MKKVEQIFKNILLNILLLLNPKLKSASTNSFNSGNRILFIRLNRIGDALITTPLIHLVKEKLKCKVFVLADRKNHFIFRNNPSVDEIIIFDKGIAGISKVKRFINENKIDTIVDTHDDVSATVSFIVALSKCQNKFALRKSNYKIYTRTVEKLNPTINHVILRNLELLKLFGLNYKKDEVKVYYTPPAESLKEAKELVASRNPANKFLLGVNISAGSNARFWGIERFQKLINVLKNYDLQFLLFHDPKDLDFAKQITDSKNIYPMSSNFDIFAAGILQLDLLFTPDTSVVHIASSNKIPVFGVYVKFETEDMIWSPYNTDFDCLITEEATLRNVAFEAVIKKFIPFLENNFYAKRNSKL